MNAHSKWNGKLLLTLAAALFCGTAAFAQAAQQQQPAPTPPPADKSAAPQVAPLTLESTPPPVNAEEEAAIKAFREDRNEDLTKKDKMAEDFIQKYPQSRYLAEVYNWQVKSYFSKGQVDKMEATATKELALAPNDAQTLAIVGSTLPRAINANTPDPMKRLAKAEDYCQKALDVIATMPKPESMTDEVFLNVKNQIEALAYSGLGISAFRRGKYPDAIANLDKSVKLDRQPDAVNYYILGLSNQKASHFEDAIAAYTKCAAIPGGMQATCTQNIEEAKKLAATQLSAPK